MAPFEIGFLFLNDSKFPLEGKLKLPIPILFEYGSSMPPKLNIELPTGELWFGKYVQNSDYIEGLEKMFEFYGVKPYHMVVCHYSGGPYMKFNIYNECGVEISYPFSCPTSRNLRPRRDDPFVVVRNTMELSDLELDKMAATCWFNTVQNFNGLHDIVIDQTHMTPKQKYELKSSTPFDNLGLHEGINTINLCFNKYSCTIKAKFQNGLLFFYHGWYVFLKLAKICEGDICVIQRTAEQSKFRIAVLPSLLLRQCSSTPVNRNALQRISCYKILKGRCLESGKLEMPRLFAMQIGSALGRKVKLVSSDGRVFEGKYSISRNKISGLKDMIRAYDIYESCVLVFNFVGESTFNVSIFHSLHVDHLKDINGEFISDILESIEKEENANVTAYGNETAVVDVDMSMSEEDDVEEVVVISNGSDQFVHEGIEVDAEQGNEFVEQLNLEEDLNNSFVVELKKSHLQGKGRGVYCSSSCYDLYRKWNSGTIVFLEFEGQRFEVGVHRKNRSCRFGKGWDHFVSTTEIKQGQVLNFRFIDAQTLVVFKMN